MAIDPCHVNEEHGFSLSENLGSEADCTIVEAGSR
jgi:hypothetical protein